VITSTSHRQGQALLAPFFQSTGQSRCGGEEDYPVVVSNPLTLRIVNRITKSYSG
jgi:hypothetical protein